MIYIGLLDIGNVKQRKEDTCKHLGVTTMMGRVLFTNFSTESNWFDRVSNSKLIPKATGTHQVHILEHCPFPNLHFVQQKIHNFKKPYF